MTPRTHQEHAVYFAEHWADDWELQDHVFCDVFSEVMGPDVAEATLKFNFGFIEPASEFDFGQRGAKSVNGWYVKVVLNQFTDDDEETVRKFYGVIVETSIERRGTMTRGDVTAETGTQTFHCRGLDFLLMRTTVDSSFVHDSSGEEIKVGRAIAFNLGAGRDNNHVRSGNKSQTPGNNDAPVFANATEIGVHGLTIDPEKSWNVLDIITYLLRYHPPQNIASHDELNWQPPDGGDAEIIEKLYPTVHAQGKTVKQILDEVIDRRRLVGYTINVVGDEETPKLDIFTFNATDMTLPGGTAIPANSNQQTFYFDDDPSIVSAVVAEDDATRFDVVIARGAPLGACFTIGDSRNGSLKKDWDDSLQTAYNTGASDGGAYAAMININKQAANQAFRAEDELAKVFRAFILDPDWDGKLNAVTVCPDPSKEAADGTPSGEISPFWYRGLKLLDRLPLRTDFNYSTVGDFPTTSLTVDGSQPDYLRPFAVMQLDSWYYRMDRPGFGKLTSVLLASAGRNWAASLRMQDDCPGLFIDVQGAQQHVIAEDEFTPADTEDDDDDEAQIDWKDILCTIFCEFDQHVEARWPEEELMTEADYVRELIIDVPHYRLDYLTPGTVIGVDNEGAAILTDGGYVVDDRVQLKDLARCAYEWYGRTRRAVTITRHNLVCDHTIGELITNIGTADDPVEINSVVSKIVFDIRGGNVTLYTQFAEWDPR